MQQRVGSWHRVLRIRVQSEDFLPYILLPAPGRENRTAQQSFLPSLERWFAQKFRVLL